MMGPIHEYNTNHYFSIPIWRSIQEIVIILNLPEHKNDGDGAGRSLSYHFYVENKNQLSINIR